MQGVDFIRGFTRQNDDEKSKDLSLCYSRPTLDDSQDANLVLTTTTKTPRGLIDRAAFVEDGLCAEDDPFTRHVIKPYQFEEMKKLCYTSKPKFSGKCVEIAVRNVASTIQIISVFILFKKKVICKDNHPFNRKLYKLLVRNSDCDNLSIQVNAQGGQSSILPLPLPGQYVQNEKIEIDFSISDNYGKIHAGTVICTVSVSAHGLDECKEDTAHVSSLIDDLQSAISPVQSNSQDELPPTRLKKLTRRKQIKYFTLIDPALSFEADREISEVKKIQREEPKPPDVTVTEESTFSLLDVSFKSLFQAKRPLRPSSGTRRHHTFGKTVLTVTILRGVEVPVREESAIVQPFVEVEWGNIVHATSIAEGPAPVWHQMMHFESPRQSGEHCVKLRLYDQHPVWGQQWLGEAKIPLEYHRHYQELERWIALSPLYSPVLLFGYVQASPGYSFTRIYILMKMEQPGNAKSIDDSTVAKLSKGIQRCLTVPYKINGIDSPYDAAQLSMLLSHLPTHYGPLAPRQALSISKVDHYGRAALLAVLLQGFEIQSYVLLGSSQVSKWSAFVLTVNENGDNTLWDPETGEQYNLSDSRCSLMKVSRLINHFGVWENMQKSILPHNLKYDVKTNKDWRPVGAAAPLTTNRTVQTLDLNVAPEEEQQDKQMAMQIEQYLSEKLSEWRSAAGLTTIFNRHAVSVLRNFISKTEGSPGQQLNKKELKQLHRAYHTHGFVLSLRKSSLEEISQLIASTKVHNVTGPIEFALACHVQRFIGKTCFIWLALVILRSRD